MKEFTGYKKGVNLGGWLSQCVHTKEHYDSFIGEPDIEKIASLGFDHVRLPVDYNVVQNDDGSFIESGFRYIDSCIEWCGRYGLKMVLDIHKAAGYVFDDKTCRGLFGDDKLQEIFLSLWRELASRYSRYAEFVSFELLNEITDREIADSWNSLAARAVTEIRKISRDVKIIIGGIFNSSIYGLTLLESPADENIVFTYHCYSPMVFTHQGAGWVENMPAGLKTVYPGTYGEYYENSHSIFGSDYDDEFTGEKEKTIGTEYFSQLFETAEKIREKYDVPIYCGEYGVIDKADNASTLRWFGDIHAAFEEKNIPHAVWNYKGLDFGITDAPRSEILSQLL